MTSNDDLIDEVTQVDAEVGLDSVIDAAIDSGELEALAELLFHPITVEQILVAAAEFRSTGLGIVMSAADGLDTLESGSIIVDADGRLNIADYRWGVGLEWSRSDSTNFFAADQVRVPARVVLIDPNPFDPDDI
jgi:hypothetical protein